MSCRTSHDNDRMPSASRPGAGPTHSWVNSRWPVPARLCQSARQDRWIRRPPGGPARRYHTRVYSRRDVETAVRIPQQSQLRRETCTPFLRTVAPGRIDHLLQPIRAWDDQLIIRPLLADTRLADRWKGHSPHDRACGHLECGSPTRELPIQSDRADRTKAGRQCRGVTNLRFRRLRAADLPVSLRPTVRILAPLASAISSCNIGAVP